MGGGKEETSCHGNNRAQPHSYQGAGCCEEEAEPRLGNGGSSRHHAPGEVEVAGEEGGGGRGKGGCSLVCVVFLSQVPGGGARRGKEEGRVGEEVREKEDMWSSSQDSMSGWCSEEMELEHLQALSRCSTDDDKISK